MQQDRINLDWIRGLAALMVCALHGREITWVGLRQFMLEQRAQGPLDIALAYLCAPIVWGSIGVPIFFVLSGYVIHAAHAPRIIQDPAWRLDVKRFYQRRFVRIYAVLIGAIALTFLLDSAVGRVTPTHVKLGDLSLSTLVGNLFALQGTLVRPYGSDGPLWTLAIEVHFYAIYPLLLIARRRLSPEALLIGGAVLSLASHALLQASGIELFTSYYFCWLLGFYAAELKARGWLPHRRRSIATAAGAAAAIGCAVFFMSQYYAFIVWSMAFYLYLLNILSRPPAEGRMIRALSAIGAFSYTLYAVHEPMIVFLHSIVANGVKSYSMVDVLLFLLAAIALSALVYRMFEKPSLVWLAGSTARKRTQRMATDNIALH